MRDTTDAGPGQPGRAPHDWAIDESQYRRQEQRRGRRHAFEHIDSGRAALVVIDMVPFFVEPSASCRVIVPTINLLACELRKAGGMVAWVVPGPVEPTARAREFYGDEVAERYARSGGTGRPAERVWGGLEVKPGDVAVEKTASSAFFPGRSVLPDLLVERGIDTVIMTGTVTNVCVESSVRDASTLDFRVVLVAPERETDAVGRSASARQQQLPTATPRSRSSFQAKVRWDQGPAPSHGANRRCSDGSRTWHWGGNCTATVRRSGPTRSWPPTNGCRGVAP